MLSFNEFKTRIDNIDNVFLSYFSKLEDIYKEKTTDLYNAKKEIETYSTEAFSKNTKTLNEYLTTVNGLLAKIKETKVIISKIDNSIKFNSYAEALKYLEDNSEAIKKQLSSINSYKFESSAFTYSFEGEKAIINGKEYLAPDFPELNISDFNTDSKYQTLISELYCLCQSQAKCIEFLIDFETKDEFQNNIKSKEQTVSNIVTDSVNATYEERLEKYVADFKNRFDLDYSRFLAENEKELNDYQSIESLKIPLSFCRSINIGSLLYKFTNYKKYQSEISKLDSDSLVKENLNYPFCSKFTTNG